MATFPCYLCYENRKLGFFSDSTDWKNQEPDPSENANAYLPCVGPGRDSLLVHARPLGDLRAIPCTRFGLMETQNVMSWVVFGLMCAVVLLLGLLFYVWAQ